MGVPLALALYLAGTALAAPANRPCVKGINSYDALRKCQDKSRLDFIEKEYTRTGEMPSEAALDRIDSAQRLEARRFFKRNIIETGAKQEGKALPDSAETTGRDGVLDKDLEDLKASLSEQSENGKNGVTPEMAEEARETILRHQDQVSPDMAQLLEAASQDGPNLTAPTMRKVQAAAREAKAAGMDLGIDAKTENQLLNEPITDDGPPTN